MSLGYKLLGGVGDKLLPLRDEKFSHPFAALRQGLGEKTREGKLNFVAGELHLVHHRADMKQQ